MYFSSFTQRTLGVLLPVFAAYALNFTACRAQPEPPAATATPAPEQRPADTLVAPLYPATRVAEAPDFEIETLEGGSFSLHAQRGKVVVINFWATWCPPCRQEMPDFVALQQELGARGLQFVGISLDQDAEAQVRAFAAQIGINYPVGIDDGTVEAAYGPITMMPTTFVIDRAGNVRHYAPGMLSGAVLRPALLALLEEPS